MFKDSYSVLGVMSGTSLDGVDIALVHLSYHNKWNYKIEIAETIPYSIEWKKRLTDAVTQTSDEVSFLNKDYTKLLANEITNFISKNNLQSIDAVCSHGHTVFHDPKNKFTLQIGNLPEIATMIGLPVVCDFRVQDVLFGGQGAPLVPIGDQMLFNDYDYCINLGGFSNLSFDNDKTRYAYDISPLNTVLNFYANLLGKEYDSGGEIAKKGNLNTELFKKLNDVAYYEKAFPKSLGIESVHSEFLPILDSFDISIEDKMCTFVHHSAYQISLNLKNNYAKVLLTGGGVYNTFFIDKVKEYASYSMFEIPNDILIQFKEALIFAFLGVLKLRNEVNVLSSVTGATSNHSSGKIYLP